jgi:hypothetical protein
MKKIILTAGLLASMLFKTAGQSTSDKNTDYEKRQLKVDEVNFVTSYYHQEGNNSAVTGGIGTEKLTDYANSIDLKLSKFDAKNRQHNFTLDFNIDYYTSASSDNIDPRNISSASSADIHVYPSVSWSMKDAKSHTTKGLSYSFSSEYDYQSHGFTLNWAKASKDNNREFSVKGSAFLDKASIILPIELRTTSTTTQGRGDRQLETKPRNSYSLALSLSQVINDRLQVLLVTEPSYQEGFLSTSFHRIFFTNGKENIERLPGNRIKLPIGVRANYFLGDNTILRGFYRFYADSWGMVAHTINLEASYKITPFVSISPYYRFNAQTAVDYFEPYGKHDASKLYHTSDYDIGEINTNFLGSGIRLAPVNGVLGMKHWSSVELRYGYYTRSTGMVANIVTLHTKFK